MHTWADPVRPGSASDWQHWRCAKRLLHLIQLPQLSQPSENCSVAAFPQVNCKDPRERKFGFWCARDLLRDFFSCFHSDHRPVHTQWQTSCTFWSMCLNNHPIHMFCSSRPKSPEDGPLYQFAFHFLGSNLRRRPVFGFPDLISGSFFDLNRLFVTNAPVGTIQVRMHCGANPVPPVTMYQSLCKYKRVPDPADLDAVLCKRRKCSAIGLASCCLRAGRL